MPRVSKPKNEDAASRFHRLLDILHKLARPQGATYQELASLYGVDKRTIERDVNDLRHACFDVEHIGRGKGYRIHPKYAALARSLQMEELLCLAAATALLRAEKTVAESTYNAFTKLVNFSKGEKHEVAQELMASVTVGSQAREHQGLSELMMATASHLAVQFDYSGEFREVEPWTLLYQGEAWFLQGFCLLRGEPRTFRVHRMENLRLTSRKFDPPRERPRAGFHRWDLAETAPVTVLCRVTPELASWLVENPVHPTQRVEQDRFELQVRNLDRLASWILSLTGIEVLQPPELRSLLGQRAKALADTYGG